MSNLLRQIQAVLTNTPHQWGSLTGTIPLELLSRRPAPQEWSALECLNHLLDTEKLVFPKRLEALLAGRDFEAFHPEAHGSQAPVNLNPADLAAEFHQVRGVSLKTLAKVTPGDLSRTARHSELGLVTLSELLNEWAGHDLLHLVQAGRALMQPFITGSGPWRPYFKEHEIKVCN